LTRAVAATVLGVGTLVPAATLITQGAAHADNNGIEGDSNEGDANGQFSNIAYQGDVISNLFGTETAHSASDISNDDGGNFHLCDVADVFC
jgi:hypothetical protein